MATFIIKSSTSDNQALVDSTGHLYVTTGGGSISTDANLTEVGGAPIALGQTTMANSLPVVIASNQSAISTTNASVGTTGITAPTSATEVGGINTSGNLQALSLDSSGNLLISGTSTVSGTVNTNLNGLNAFAITQYLVGTSAVQVVIPSGTSSIGFKVITTSSTDAVLVGPTSSVTNSLTGTGNGYFLFNGDAVQIDLTPTATVWLIGTSAGQIVCVLFAGG
jgi:hypothetical protein